jgi:hypothetical protein
MALRHLPGVDDLAAPVEERADEQRPAARLQVAIAIGHELTELSDAVIGRFVAEARATGLSWPEVGETFGISKQAAQQRYGAATDDLALLRHGLSGRRHEPAALALDLRGPCDFTCARHQSAVPPGSLMSCTLRDRRRIASRALGHPTGFPSDSCGARHPG